jgi:hypothetical protein
MATPNESFFQRLTRIFRSGPAIQRKVKGYDNKTFYNSQLIQGNYGQRGGAPYGFGRENTPFSVLGAYGILDRMTRYAEFSEMEYTPEIARALDIMAEETVGGDDRGKCFHIYSKNSEIKASLEDLFYDTLNVEFNLKPWVRNLCKYGDFFLFNEILPDVGIVAVSPIRVNEIEREEGYDPEDPYAVRFKWLSRGNKYLENWQVSHFRIQGNDSFLPYGTSMLESSRRIWRQLIMYEDAMLTYRIVRSPERRVFYIDVGHVPAHEVSNYLESVKSALRSRGNIDRATGREDMRHNAQSMLDDYFIPVRGEKTGTKIDTLSGGQHITATEDVEFIQAKLFAALQVPKPYLNFMEGMSAKASLSQMDVRFSRTVNTIQKIVISELNKLAMIHLYSKGFDGADLIDFELKLSNPSSVALQQKLELWTVKFDLAGTAKDTRLVDENWIQKNILELGNDEIKDIIRGLRVDRLRDIELESMEPVEPNLAAPPKTTDSFNPMGYKPVGAGIPKNPAENSPVDQPRGQIGLDDSDIQIDTVADSDTSTPIKATPFLTQHKRNRVRRLGVGRGTSNTSMPDIPAMLSPKNKYTKDINGTKTESVDLEAMLPDHDDTGDYRLFVEPNFGREMSCILRRLESAMDIRKKDSLLMEDIDLDIEDIESENKLISEVIKYDGDDSEIIETVEEKTLKEVFGDDS